MPATRSDTMQPSRTRASSAIRVIFFLFLLFGTALGSMNHVERIRNQYDKLRPSELTAPTSERPEKAAGLMANQSDVYQGWSVGILVAVVGILITANIGNLRAVPYREWTLLALAPSGGLLIGSIWAGIVFSRRHTYLVSRDRVGSDNSLNALLGSQADLFLLSLIPLLAFVIAFALALLWGKSRRSGMKLPQVTQKSPEAIERKESA